MGNVLFWNAKKQQDSDLLSQMALEFDVKLLLIAELGISPAKVLLSLNKSGTRFRFHPSVDGIEQVAVFSVFPRRCIKQRRDFRRLRILHIQPVWGFDFLLAVAHLHSKLYLTDDDQSQLYTEYSKVIHEEEDRVGHTRTVLVGDLNMSPFEKGMVSGHGFHAVNSRTKAESRVRSIVGAESRRFFYNPMWRFLGERGEHPPGTYHYSGNRPIEFFWYAFDQVLVRPDLLPSFDDDLLKIVQSVNGESLLSRSGIPNRRKYSDHLPIVFSLDYE